ncbi:hypothetical protein HELRODRAFT_189125 [Helobdella robusta]|uniref:G-protein coupled receptors family 1 profile domain-containing protein n=1 Tax=Helobdella robusta TaxID=6412 RepID=T1FQP5_HELRO|nr:hypothetical protein HELRODRAFT_189125 [Helobdella robusta]ESN96151.1 hypothetical protein HELRODRAFT_189125 [Helobdella robusta]
MEDESGDIYSPEMVEPVVIAYSIDDCILPAFHPPPPMGRLWPENIINHIHDISTALVYLIPGLLAICTVAFDTVDHTILLRLLHLSFNITDSCLSWFSSYLCNRFSSVVLNNSTSNSSTLTFGVPQGNLVAIIVLKRLYTGVLSTGLYVLLSLLIDIIVVWLRCGMEWMRLATNTNVREIIVASSLVLCKIYPFISSTLLLLSTWLTVMMAAETAWVHQHPQRLMRVCKIGRARLMVLAVVFLSVSVNCPSFWTYSLYTSPVVVYTPDAKQTANDGDSMVYDEKFGEVEMDEVVSSDVQGRPTCANEIMDERLLVAAAASLPPKQSEETISFPGLDYRKTILMVVDLLLLDLLPYFIVFSSAVMLVTKRLRRKDQVRQIDNTWKACNIDSGVAHQLHSTFICLCLAHTILMFPKLVYKTFLLVTDLQVTGLVSYPVEHRPCTIVAKTVCYLLHYTFMSCKLFLFLGSSTAFRGECLALITCNSTCEPVVTSGSVSDDHVSTGLPLLHNNNNNTQHQNECTVLETTGLTNLSMPATTTTQITPTTNNALSLTSSLRSTPNNYIPHPPPPSSIHHSTLSRMGKPSHVTMNTNTLPLHRTVNFSTTTTTDHLRQPPPPSQLASQQQPLRHLTAAIPEVTFADDVKPEDPVASSAAILENGAPCIKIFSMTSV